MPAAANDVTLSINGKTYGGWERLTVSRNLARMSSAFLLETADRWDPKAAPWPIKPFDVCTLAIGGDLVMTGYVDTALPVLEPRRHSIAIQGRSKTEDLIDCTPDLPGGQFNGYTLDKIARAVCQPFGIGVIVQASVGEAFPDATVENHETGYRFLERLARLRSVLLTDDASGNLVLTTAGSTRATTQLKEGVNIRRIAPRLTSIGRFSRYTVKTQVGTTTPAPAVNPSGPAPPAVNPATSIATQRAAAAAQADAEDPPQTPAVTVTMGTATDPGVPRYRPHTILAESALDAAGARARAQWECSVAFGRSVHVMVDVAGWRQNDGTLWTLNTLASVVSPTVQLDGELLIASLVFELGPQGRITHLGLGPVEGYTPSPAQVHARKPTGPGGPGYTTDIPAIPVDSIRN